MQRKYYTPQPRDPRDYKAGNGLLRSLKRVFYPRPFNHQIAHNVSVEDQLETNSCVAHAVTSAVECLVGTGAQFSRLANYWGAREYSNTTHIDAGAYLRDGLKALNKFTLFEAAFPFTPADILKPPPLAYPLDLEIKFEALGLNINLIKDALLAGKPVGLAFDTPHGFGNLGRRSSQNIDYEPCMRSGLYHAVWVYGYNLTGFLFQNSYGKRWGNAGCGVLNFNYFVNDAVVDVSSVGLVK